MVSGARGGGLLLSAESCLASHLAATTGGGCFKGGLAGFGPFSYEFRFHSARSPLGDKVAG